MYSEINLDIAQLLEPYLQVNVLSICNIRVRICLWLRGTVLQKYHYTTGWKTGDWLTNLSNSASQSSCYFPWYQPVPSTTELLCWTYRACPEEAAHLYSQWETYTCNDREHLSAYRSNNTSLTGLKWLLGRLKASAIAHAISYLVICSLPDQWKVPFIDGS